MAIDENGRLAMLVKQGDQEAAGILWERVERLIFKLMSKYFPLCSRCGIEPDDLKQAGYFAMMRAAEAYDLERGLRFTSYLNHHTRNIAMETMGIRGHKSRPRHVKSLDESLPGAEDDSITLADMVPDPAATERLEQVERDVYAQQLHDALEECLNALPDDQGEVIRARFYGGHTLGEVARIIDKWPETVRQLECKGLRGLRKPQGTRKLQSYREDIIDQSYRGVGWRSFVERQGSTVELAVERLERENPVQRYVRDDTDSEWIPVVRRRW